MKNPLSNRTPSALADLAHFEVIVMWGEQVLHVAHRTGDEVFAIGQGDKVDYLVNEATAAGATTLLEGGVLRIPAGLSATLESTEGASTISGDVSLPADATAIFNLGDLTFRVKPVERAEKIASSGTIDKRPFSYIGGSLLVHALMLIIFSLSPPKASSMTIQDIDRDSRLVAFMTEAEAIEEPEEEISWMEDAGAAEGDGGHEGDEGEAGDPEEVAENRRLQVRGPRDNQDIRLPREITRTEIETTGIIGALASVSDSFNTPTSPLGAASALGADPMSYLGNLIGDDVGNANGWNGLGMVGTGRASGTRGTTIGVGTLGTIGGGGNCRGENCAYGPGTGTVTSRRRSGRIPPRVTGGRATSTGALSREVIRRVIRRANNQVRHCYEQGLQQRPDLEGRVTARFTISPSGSVVTSNIVSSQLRNQGVESCVNRVVQRLSFPQPSDGGLVTVSYPFMMRSTN